MPWITWKTVKATEDRIRRLEERVEDLGRMNRYEYYSKNIFEEEPWEHHSMSVRDALDMLIKHLGLKFEYYHGEPASHVLAKKGKK